MSKLSKEELERIVERDLPDHRLVSGPAETDAPQRRQAQAAAPDLATLQRKYGGGPDRGGEAARTDAARDAEDGDVDPADDEIVVVEPKGSRDAWDRGAGPKAAVISGSEKRVIGLQG